MAVLTHRDDGGAHQKFDRYLFSGDHVSWEAGVGALHAFRDSCWFGWTTRIGSVPRSMDSGFEWVLPAHGRRSRLSPERMRAELSRLHLRDASLRRARRRFRLDGGAPQPARRIRPG